MLSTYFLIIVVITVTCAVPRDEYVGSTFYRTDSRLVEVPSDIPSEAIEVYLQDNKITLVKTGTFGHLSVCITLHIHNNSISTIEGDAFTGMTKLDVLYLYENKLTALEKNMFNGLDSLTYLHIQYNQISTIPSGCFSDVHKLLYLYLGGNKLTEISGNMWLHSLKHLYLHNNDITAVNPGDVDYLPNIEILLLHGNEFSTVSYKILNPTLYPDTDGHPRKVQLSFGAMLCDSRLCWLKQGERLGWITWYTYSGKTYYPDCINHPGTWPDIDLNCPENIECTTYTETQCVSKCESTGRRLDEFNADSTCPCKCTCPDFDKSSCAIKCQEEGKQVAPIRDQFNCLRCECACPPYNNNTCHSQCELENKIQIMGATNRFGCDICQCGCLNRDCDTECDDLDYRVTNGNQGCIVGCQCICPDDCEPNCHGCVRKDDRSDDSSIVTLALSVVGVLIGGIVICGLVVLLCLKRKGIKPFKQGLQHNDEGNPNSEPTESRSDVRNTQSVQYDEIGPSHINEAGPSGASGLTSPYVNVGKRAEGPDQYQPLGAM